MTVSLYAIGEEFAALEAALTESLGEWTPEIEAQFAALNLLEAERIDAYAGLCRSQDAYQRSLKDEETALREKRKVSEHLVARLRSRLQDYMEARGLREIRGKIWKAVIQNNGGLRALTLMIEPAWLPPEFQIVTVEADTGKLREVIADTLPATEGPVTFTMDGQDVARLEPRSRSVRFR